MLVDIELLHVVVYYALNLDLATLEKEYIISFMYEVNKLIHKSPLLVEPFQAMSETTLRPNDAPMTEGVPILKDKPIIDNIGDGSDHIPESTSHLDMASHSYVHIYLLLLLPLYFYIIL